MNDKPTYLGLLNAIALAEGRAFEVLSAWRDATADRELAGVLDVVAIREQEHAAAFTKRLCELGYSVKESPCSASGEFERSLAVARSQASDLEKFRQVLGYGAGGEEDDPLARLFDDHSIDRETGALLGRFIAEERDSERRLKGQWRRLQSAPPASAGDDALLADMAARIDRLARTIEELKALRR